MPVEASWTTSDGAAVKHIAETLLVSRNGGVLRMDEKLSGRTGDYAEADGRRSGEERRGHA